MRVIVILAVVGVIALQFMIPLFSGEALAPLGPAIAAGVGLVAILATWFAFRAPAHERREFRDAPLGVGSLVSARATGTSINDQPEVELTLDVETPDGRIIRGTARTIINQVELAQLSAATTVPVRYLDDGRFAVAPNAPAEELEKSLYSSRLARGVLTPQQVDVATRGTESSAVVMSMQPTGEISEGQAILHLELRVTRPDGTLFDTVRETPAPAAALADLQPGSVVQVRYLPDDESYVAISTRVG